MKEKIKGIIFNEMVFKIGCPLLITIGFVLGFLTIFQPFPSAINDFSIFQYSTRLSQQADINYYSLLVVIVAFLGFVIEGIGIFVLVVKKNRLSYLPIFYNLLFIILIFLFLTLYSKSSALVIFFIIMDFILSIVAFTYLLYYRRYNIDMSLEATPMKKIPSLMAKRISLGLIIIGFVIIILLFFYPIYNEDGFSINAASCLGAKSFSLVYISFIVVFVMFVLCLLQLLYVISSYSNSDIFIKRTKNIFKLYIGCTVLFFLTSFGICFYGALKDREVTTTAYIPCIIIFILTIAQGAIIGLYGGVELDSDLDSNKKKQNRELTLILTIVIAAISVIALSLNVMKITMKVNMGVEYENFITLTGFELLRDYPNLDAGLQVIAFGIVVMLIANAAGVLLTIVSYLSRSTYFKASARYTIAMNLLFVALVSISGIYFVIANKMSENAILSVINQYFNFDVSGFSYQYTIETDMMYALIVDALIIAILIAKKAIDKTEYNLINVDGNVAANNQNKASEALSTNSEEGNDFDHCPAFTEIDSHIADYMSDYRLRMQSFVQTPSLNGLIRFVVEFARNYHIHLSYSLEDIATFVAGLGSTRLSILQGMSGTGKTSLPKIFAKAIYGNCEIIEVESSWKDKNELLGYYNEFSERYTPKKFTQALYKAALNPQIPTFIVLDEMNLSRIEYYFSDFLSLLENEEDNQFIKLANVSLNYQNGETMHSYRALINGHTLKIPKNVWFIGTANRDESTYVISDKVYDRANTMNFNKRASKVRGYKDEDKPVFYSYAILNNLLNEAIANGSFDAEENETIKSVEEILAPYNISFGNRILMQIEKFVNIYQACFSGTNVTADAVEIILLSKVVSKLETKVIEDKDELIESFEELGLKRCVQFIKTLNED